MSDEKNEENAFGKCLCVRYIYLYIIYKRKRLSGRWWDSDIEVVTKN